MVYSPGIHFSREKYIRGKFNFEKKLEDLQKILNSWKRRKLTLLGIINFVKSLGLIELIYNASALSLSEEFAIKNGKKISTILFGKVNLIKFKKLHESKGLIMAPIQLGKSFQIQ